LERIKWKKIKIAAKKAESDEWTEVEPTISHLRAFLFPE
jgi:hypothetical protein